MIKNHLKTAWRRLRKSKLYTLVNILGLSISLTTSILIILWVKDERSFDKFHPDYEQVYKVNSHLLTGESNQIWSSAPNPIFLYAKELSSVESTTRMTWGSGTLIKDTTSIPYVNTAYIDNQFFSMFNFQLVEGTSNNLEVDPYNALITQQTAEKLFGKQHVVGETFRYYENNFTVVGVLADIPQNSTINFDLLLPMAYHAQQFTANGGNGEWKTIDEDLGSFSFDIFIKLDPKADRKMVEQGITESYQKARNGESFVAYSLNPLKDLHLITANGNKSALRIVQIFTIIAILLLIIGAVNYINLSTARSIERAKGVAVHRIIGASQKQLFIQFITETCIIFIISTLSAFLFISILTPGYNTIAGKSLTFSLKDDMIWLYIGGAIIGTLILASIYPALQLSSFHPVNALKGRIRHSSSNESLRKALVIFQFTISVTLIICTLVIGNQLHYIRMLNLGYDREHVFTVHLPSEALKHSDSIKDDLRKSTAIKATSFSGFSNLMDYHNATGDIDWPGKAKDNQLIVGRATVDNDFIPLMDFQFIEGSNFSGLPADSAAYVVNETLVKQMGLQPPYVGTDMSLHDRPGKIIGVVKDFHFRSVKEKIDPIVLWTHNWAGILYVKTTEGKAQQAIKAVEAIYNKYPSNVPFSYKFLDSQFDALYKSDSRTGILFNIFSGIAIFISALGLFALTTHNAQTRIKEIGIRKVLGASVFGVVSLLGKSFVVLVCAGILIACPIALYLMNQWLGNFAYKVDLSIWTFVFGSVIAVVIAIATISYQAIRAARANPVDSLRDE